MNSDNLRLKEVAILFLKLGCIGFGGPAVHIAMMEEEVVRKRKWLSHEYFLDLIGATNLIPGPNSTEMTMHIGEERAGWKGLVVAGLCFILPAVMITGGISYAYQKYGELPEVQPFLYGVKPAIISVVIAMMISLSRKALKSFELGLTGIVALILAIYRVNEIYILFGGGLSGLLIQALKNRKSTIQSIVPLILLPGYRSGSADFNWKIFWIFLKIGSILYGSGYVLFAFLDTELVKTGLLSKQKLIDAIAIGQITPGPVFSSATFIGWQLGGFIGAAAATIGIFLPSFLFVTFLTPLILRLRESKMTSAFLDTVNVVSIALIIIVCIEMGKASIVDWRTILIAIVSLAVTSKFKHLNSVFVILGGAGLGYVLSLI